MRKKIFNLFAIISVCLAILCSFSCTFVDNGTNSGESGGDGDKSAPYTAIADATTVTLKNSVSVSSEITFNSAEHEVLNEKGETVDAKYSELNVLLRETHVERSVVTLYCTYGNYASVGSGVIVDVDDGVDFGEKENNIFYIITCHHVIDSLSLYDNNQIVAYLTDSAGLCYDDDGYNENYRFTGYVGGAVENAKMQAVSLVGGDKSSDIAVLRLYIASEDVADTVVKAKVISVNDSLELGESVFAVGNPLGTHAGWVSAIGSVADLQHTSNVENIGNMTLLGINVSIHPGNSGGGLFNMYGELVGITNSGDAVEVRDVYNNTHIISQGLNAAVGHKITDDKNTDKGFINIASQLIGTYNQAAGNYGYISGRRVMFGFTLEENVSGVVVTSVSSGSFAEEAGLRVRDVITEIKLNNGESNPVSAISDVDAVISVAQSGDTITFALKRTSRGTASTVTVSLTVCHYYFCNTENYAGISA